MELSDDNGKLTFIDNDGRSVYHTKITGRKRVQQRIVPNTREHTTLLKNFFINDRNTDVVSAFWKWYSPIKLR